MRPGRWVVGLGTVLLFGSVSGARAGDLEGRLGAEMEYLGQSYFSEQELTALDLGLPAGSGFLIVDTTRFADDTWLPGQLLELDWRGSPDTPAQLSLASRTEGNRERFSQDLDFRLEAPAGARGWWRLGASGSLVDDRRSLVGHGDWSTALRGAREFALGARARGTVRLDWERSRTRGDTTSYLYDYDILRARLGASQASIWLPVWDAVAEVSWKRVPGGGPGGYAEARATGSWRPSDGVTHLDVEVRFRAYAGGGVGRDLLAAESRTANRLAGGDAGSLLLETRTTLSDYRGQDELYFDSVEFEGYLPWKQPAGSWTVAAGPAGSFLADLDGGDRDYVEGSVRGGLNRILGTGGFTDLTASAGYRDYRSGAANWIEIATLSSSVLRSDTWILELLGLAEVPLGSRFSLNILASTSWEIHVHESERVQVTYASAGIGRRF